MGTLRLRLLVPQVTMPQVTDSKQVPQATISQQSRLLLGMDRLGLNLVGMARRGIRVLGHTDKGPMASRSPVSLCSTEDNRHLLPPHLPMGSMQCQHHGLLRHQRGGSVRSRQNLRSRPPNLRMVRWHPTWPLTCRAVGRPLALHNPQATLPHPRVDLQTRVT